jgi:hypothetical protein
MIGHKLSIIVCVGTESDIVYVLEGKAMAKENIPFLTLVMRVDEFVVLHFFEFLDFRPHDRVGRVRVD